MKARYMALPLMSPCWASDPHDAVHSGATVGLMAWNVQDGLLRSTLDL